MSTTYEITTRGGNHISVCHDLSDDDCARIILTAVHGASDFAFDLAYIARQPKGLSFKQRAWLHILADEVLNPGEDNLFFEDGEQCA